LLKLTLAASLTCLPITFWRDYSHQSAVFGLLLFLGRCCCTVSLGALAARPETLTCFAIAALVYMGNVSNSQRVAGTQITAASWSLQLSCNDDCIMSGMEWTHIK